VNRISGAVLTTCTGQFRKNNKHG